MAKVFSFIKEYQTLELPVKNAIASEFFIQAVNATFMNILPLYMTRQGFDDSEIALFITFRFIGVFILALPLGKYIKGKKVMPLFYLSNTCVPLFGIAIVLSIAFQIKWLTLITLILWGGSFTFMQIPIFPFILRNTKKVNQTAAISLSYSTWSFGGILSGIVIAVLDFINPTFFDEKFILILFSLIGFGGIFFLKRIKNFDEVSIEIEPENGNQKKMSGKTEWNVVLKALLPTLIIATGAGLTIPFISLFFDKVHHVGKGGFSSLSFIASILVAYFAMLVPKIKEKIGYKIAIPTTQSLAVIALVALATTQYYSQYSLAIVIASVCYLLRQPLMNMAGPMTSELVLNYVGRNNREITSALTSAIWSGSWVLSGFMVTILFAYNFSFGNIFLITSLLYAFGVVLYYLLILDYAKKEEQGLIDE
ncbi:MFS transporter [Aurantibacillus circumpalustris]|uniref:MFS transporter n=1 Tax=Aurantibacillus circumpalustris TaxID=3036359 RepID=UPI00295BED54|nr:MFS transporter [Aurantibacillus circumpalustris]